VIARLAHQRIHYGWIVAGTTFLTLICAAAFRSTPSVLMVPLQHEYGWDRATISVAVSINLVLFGLSGPFAAASVVCIPSTKQRMMVPAASQPAPA